MSPTASPTPQTTEDYELPSAEALMAGTLALMTGYAQSCCAQHAELLGKKIVSNLFTMTEHPLLSPNFRSMLWNLHGRWVKEVNQCMQQTVPPLAERSTQLWHTAPEAVQ